MEKEKIVEKELSYKLGGIFFKIQKELGRFCREIQYGDALEGELRKENVSYKREYPVEIAGRKSNFVDFVIEDKILVDLKAKPFLEKDDFHQMKRYLETADKELGLIVNFQDKYLKPKRILNSKLFVDSDTFVVSDRSGFTLLELIIYLTIFGIVGTLAAGVFNFALKARVVVGREAEVQSTAQRVLEQMIERVHASLGINDASSTLSLKMADGAKDPTIFGLSSGEVTIKEGAGATLSITPTTTLTTQLSFTKITNPSPATSSVQITITVGYNEGGVAASSTLYTLQTTALPL